MVQARNAGNPFWVVGEPGRAGPRLVFVNVPEAKQGKNRVHLDIVTDGSQTARELVGRAKLRSRSPVLDVASGPGTVARLAGAVVCPDGRVVASDISPAMLAVARSSRSIQPGRRLITWSARRVRSMRPRAASMPFLASRGSSSFPIACAPLGRCAGWPARRRRDGLDGGARAPAGTLRPHDQGAAGSGHGGAYPHAFDPRSYSLGAAELRRLMSGLRIWSSRRWYATRCGAASKMLPPR
jgi:SAM-dependent methyltransferase